MEFRNLHLSAFSELNKVHVSAELEHLAAGNRRVYPNPENQITKQQRENDITLKIHVSPRLPDLDI